MFASKYLHLAQTFFSESLALGLCWPSLIEFNKLQLHSYIFIYIYPGRAKEIESLVDDLFLFAVLQRSFEFFSSALPSSLEKKRPKWIYLAPVIHLIL